MKERQRTVTAQGREREKKNLFYESLLKLARNSGRVMKIFKGKIVFLLFGEVSKI